MMSTHTHPPTRHRNPTTDSAHEPVTETDFYRLLEVDPKASPEVVNKAYRALVQKFHPDQYHVSNKARMEARMKAINHAYETISDPQSRRAYDRQRRIKQQRSVVSPKIGWQHPVLWFGILALALFVLKQTGRALLMIPAGKLMILAGALLFWWAWQRRRGRN